jgi:hypothetical protein
LIHDLPQYNFDTSKPLDNVGYFNYLGSMKTYDTRFTREIKSRIAMANSAFDNKYLFTTKLKLNLGKNVVKCCIWITSLNGAETWSLRTTDQKSLVSFEMWCWRRMWKISWTERVKTKWYVG